MSNLFLRINNRKRGVARHLFLFLRKNRCVRLSAFRQLLFLWVCILNPLQQEGAKNLRKRILALTAVIFLLMTAPAVHAAERGSIQIRLDAGDLAVTNGAVTLYQVGTRVADGYRIAEGFGGGIVREEDSCSANLAQWLAETAGETGQTMLLDADGCAVFSNLEDGLYMLIQTERMDGFYPILPILLTIPEEERRDVQVYREPVPIVTEIPKTGQSPAPFFGILGMILSSAGLLLCREKRRK